MMMAMLLLRKSLIKILDDDDDRLGLLYSLVETFAAFLDDFAPFIC